MKLSHKLTIFFILAIWLTLIFIEWLIPINQHLLFVIPFLQKTFSLVCHRQDYKLITQDMFHSLVCARCTGIYFGLLVMSAANIFYPFRKFIDNKLLFFVSVLMLADIICYSTGLYSYSKTIAVITGLLLGSVGFLYFYSAINQLLKEKRA